ncbi:MAG: guanylate cyclase [Chloroflexota bacterium]|nr:MAG: guanylate cyclase [Chloroflexota bacterium]
MNKTKQLSQLLANAIILPSDSEIDVRKKYAILLGNMGGFFFSVIMALLYIYNDLTKPAIFTGIYLASIIAAYGYYFKTKQLRRTVFLFSFFLFVEIIVVHISLGGFNASGAVFIWIVTCALMTITAGQTKLAVIWIILFLIATVILTYVEPMLATLSPGMPEGLSKLLFVMNFGFGLTYISSASFYFMHLLEIARKEADDLLLNILPGPIAKQLKEEPGVIADRFNEVTVLFADIVDFTRLCSGIDPVDVVNLLNTIFSDFDELTSKYGLEKIKTIGDAYMVVSGLPEARNDHCEAIVAFAFDILDAVTKYKAWNNEPICLRIGINTGPVVAGVIGHHKFIYDLWGDTVNTASRMESNGLVNVIQVTKEVVDKLEGKYEFKEREPIYVKGKGNMVTYLMQLPAK